jgi:hypothetical protein
VLTVLAATVAGVMPALKITRGMADRLKQTTAGAGGLRFGGVWTVVIVAQVAVTVVFPAIVWFENVQLRRMQDFNPGSRPSSSSQCTWNAMLRRQHATSMRPRRTRTRDGRDARECATGSRAAGVPA